MVRLERQVPLPDRVVPSTNAPRPSHASTRQASWRFPISSPDNCADQSRPGAVCYPSPRKIPRPFHAGAAGALSVLPFSGIRVRGRITWHFGLLFSRWQRVDTRTLLSEPARQYRPNMSARACPSSSLEDVVVGDGLAAITNLILDIRHVSHQAWTKMINQTLWRGQETLSPVWASAQKA